MYRLDRLLVEIPGLRPGSMGAYGLAVVLAASATALRLAIDPLVVEGVQYITYFPAVIITTFISGLGAGFFCLALSAAAAWIFILPPSGEIDIRNLNQAHTIAFFIIVATADVLLISALRFAVRRYRALSKELLAQAAALQSSEERQRILAHEIDHRAKNLLAVVQAVVSQTGATSVEEFSAAVSGRIGALAKSHSLISASRWTGADLHQIVEDELAAYRADNGQSSRICRIKIGGPKVTLLPAAAQSIALAVHELATNSVKYGALSSSAGRLSVEWQVNEEGLFLSWTEAGGPTVAGPPGRKGFGTQVIAAGIERQLGGQVAIDWRREGIVVTINIPSSALAGESPAVEQGDGPAAPAVTIADAERPLAGLRILVVEDEALISMQIERALARQRCQVIGPVARLVRALDTVRTEVVDAAIIDANLAGESSGPLVAELREREIPFIVLTGYADTGLSADFNSTTVISKPFDEENVTRQLARRLAVVQSVS